LIAPADQPQCGAPVYRRLLDAFGECGRGVVVATFAGAVRNPVLLARGQWRLAEEIHGDIGLSAVVQRHTPLEVECADIGSVADIDTPDDLARLRRSEV
jgi:nicotine blue oxidoreductase